MTFGLSRLTFGSLRLTFGNNRMIFGMSRTPFGMFRMTAGICRAEMQPFNPGVQPKLHKERNTIYEYFSPVSFIQQIQNLEVLC